MCLSTHYFRLMCHSRIPLHSLGPSTMMQVEYEFSSILKIECTQNYKSRQHTLKHSRKNSMAANQAGNDMDIEFVKSPRGQYEDTQPIIIYNNSILRVRKSRENQRLWRFQRSDSRSSIIFEASQALLLAVLLSMSAAMDQLFQCDPEVS